MPYNQSVGFDLHSPSPAQVERRCRAKADIGVRKEKHDMSSAASTIAANSLTVGLAQIAPVWLDREQTLAKVLHQIERAARPER